MTKPKIRRCPFCQSENQAIRKRCDACYASLSKSKKIEALKERLDNDWVQGVKKNRNASREVSSAEAAVEKLAALDYMPILLIGRKKNNLWIPDIIPGMALTEDIRPFVNAMKEAYEYLLKKQGPQMPQPQPQPDLHIQQLQNKAQHEPIPQKPPTIKQEPQPPESPVHHQPWTQLQVPTQPQLQQIQPWTANPSPRKRKKVTLSSLDTDIQAPVCSHSAEASISNGTSQINMCNNSAVDQTNNQMKSDGSNTGGTGNLPASVPLSMPGMRKPWHEDVTQDQRKDLVHRLARAILPYPDPAALKDGCMEKFVAYASKVEGNMFESANSRDEYHYLLALKLCMIWKYLEEKKVQTVKASHEHSRSLTA